jgi:glycosyltransferase involved in cell wall biosynthesis
MPELIQSGESGFLVNTVTEAVEAVARIDTIDRTYCRRHVEKYFTVERMIRDYTHVYEAILQDRPL